MKSLRHGQILKLIRSQNISTQEELARALKRSGVDATQVTLSRDMRELGLVKTSDGYRQLAHEANNMQFVQDVRSAQNQIILKTAPGHASTVAVALDDEQWPEVVGTLAGDDTILVICQDTKTANGLKKKLLLQLRARSNPLGV